MRQYRAWAQRRQQDAPDAALRAARATMRRKKFCLVTTVGRDGVSARVLQPFPPDPDLTVWFGTSASSRKVAELRADSRATVVYQDDSTAACVVLGGRMDVVESPTVRQLRFMPTWYAFWPEGPTSADFVVLHFVPDRIEVWDGSRGITPEPFGLRSACLTQRDGVWVTA
jgi:general stress protein 26